MNEEIRALLEQLKQKNTELITAYGVMKDELKNLGAASTEAKTRIDQILSDENKIKDDLVDLTKRVHDGMFSRGEARKSLSEIFIGSEQYKRLIAAPGEKRSGPVLVKSFAPWLSSKTVTSDPTSAGPGLPGPMRIGIFQEPKQALRVRDLLTVAPTTLTSIEFVRTTFTNASAMIYASPAQSPYFENVEKPESDLKMTLATEVVRTVAHWLAASKQILMDIGQLRSIIDDELMYGLKLVEEDQILFGDGTQANLNGIATQATAYDTNLNVQDDTKIDKLRHAILQARLAQYSVDGIVLNPADWHDIELSKDGDKRYIIGDPRGQIGPSLWGRPIVESDSMNSGDFLTGAFRSARLYDREEAIIETSDSHDKFFTHNMVAIRCEERLALVVPRPQAFIYGSF